VYLFQVFVTDVILTIVIHYLWVYQPFEEKYEFDVLHSGGGFGVESEFS